MGNILNLIYDDINVTQVFLKDYMESYLSISNYKLVHIDDIESVKDENSIYLYFHFDYLINQINLFGGLPLSEDVIQKMHQYPKLYVVFLNDSESDTDDAIRLVDIEIKRNNLNSNRFYISNWNQSLHESKERHNSEINVHIFNRGDHIMAGNFIRHGCDFVEDKEFLFMNLNRNIKNHRFLFLCFLKKYNILDDTDWSWLRGFEMKVDAFKSQHGELLPDWYYFQIFDKSQIDNLKPEIEYIRSVDIKKSKLEQDVQIDFPPYHLDWEKMWELNPYKNSYINIVGETNYLNENVVVICEKTYTPLYFCQIPIFLASPGHVKKIKELYGFDLFDDLINHDYDNEPDHGKRMLMVLDEVKKLHSNKEQVIEFYKNNKERLLSNKNKFYELKNRVQLDVDFFNGIANKI